jgi:hypothetical protein
MSGEKVRASRARVYSPPEGVTPDQKVHVYVFDVFHDEFLPGKAFESVERAVQFQRHEQERIYTEQEADPELFDLPFVSADPDLVKRVAGDAEYRDQLMRVLSSEARARAKHR